MTKLITKFQSPSGPITGWNPSASSTGEGQANQPIGSGVRVSSDLVAGNYQNIAGLNARQRRLLRKHGFQYVGRNGQIYKFDPGVLSRAEMRKIYLQQKRDLEEYSRMRELGLGDEVNDVYRAYASNPDADYIIYDPERKRTSQTQSSAATPSSYKYSFDGYTDATKGMGNLYLQIVKNMGADNWARYANNGILDNNSMIEYIKNVGGLSNFNGTDLTNDDLKALNTKLGTNYTYTPIQKQGGKMNKFQYGGAVNQQQAAQEQAQAQQQQLTEIFQAIAQKPQETLAALQKQGIQPKQIIDLAQKMADKNPAAKAALQAVAQLQQMAKQGAKLEYFKRLRGHCPEGYELKMFKAGGKVCTKCQKIMEEKKGGEVKGNESDVVKEFKSKRCGGKMKKK